MSQDNLVEEMIARAETRLKVLAKIKAEAIKKPFQQMDEPTKQQMLKLVREIEKGMDSILHLLEELKQ